MSSFKNEKGSSGSIQHSENYSDTPVDLANNVNARCVLLSFSLFLRSPPPRIKNPLKGIPKEKLFAQVAEFCSTNGFSDRVPLFQKAALVAQNPTDFDSIEELDEQDRIHLRREITSASTSLIFYLHC